MTSKICPKCKTAIPKIKIEGIFALIKCPKCKEEITVFKDARQIEAERDKNSNDLYAQNKHDVLGNSINRWLASAKYLLCAVKLIEDQYKKDEPNKNCSSIAFNAYGVNFMLEAYSLECLLKAIQLNEGKKLFIDGKLDKNSDRHDLLYLSKMAGITDYDDVEKKLLRVLYQFSTAYGRYPITKDYKNTVGINYPVNHFEIFKNIIKKLLKKFPLENDYQSNLDYIHELIS